MKKIQTFIFQMEMAGYNFVFLLLRTSRRVSLDTVEHICLYFISFFLKKIRSLFPNVL